MSQEEPIYSKTLVPVEPEPEPQPEPAIETVQETKSTIKSALSKILSLDKKTVLSFVLWGAGAIFIAFLLISLFLSDWSWTSKQWILGTAGCVVIFGGISFLVYYLHERSYIDYFAPSLLLLCGFTAINYFLFIIFQQRYEILFGCFNVWGIAFSLFLTVLAYYHDESDQNFIPLLAIFWNVFGVILSVLKLYETSWKNTQWALGIVGGLFLFFIVIGFVKYCEDELTWDSHRLGTIILGVVVLANLPILLLLQESYEWIYFCVTILEIIGGILLAKISFDEYDGAWGALNLVEIFLPVVETVLLIMGILTWEWRITQWIVGIGASILLLSVCLALIFILDDLSVDGFPLVSTVCICGVFLINLLLYLFVGANYKTVFLCITVTETISAGILTALCLMDAEEDWAIASIAQTFVCALTTLFGILGLRDWNWAHWQWLIGVIGGIMLFFLVFLLVRFLDDEDIMDFYVAGFILVTLLLVGNGLLAYSLRENYKYIFCCVSSFALIGLGILSYLSFDDAEDNWGKLYIGEAIACAALMIINIVVL